jgi:hypothetical protein
VGGHHG